MQILLRLKMHLHLSTRKKHFLINGSIEKKISILNETINNVMSNYIPDKIKVFDDQKPPWMNAEFENLIAAKNDIFKNT